MSYKLHSLSKTFIVAIISLLAILAIATNASAATTLEDGEYTLNYEILQGDKNNNSTSLADGYWNKPAKLIVKDGVIHVRTTINKNAWVTAFSTSYKGSFVDTKVISTNESNDSRVTEFKVESIDDILDAKMSVLIPDIDYDHSYSVRFKFYTDSLKLTSAAATPAPTATPKPAETTKPAETAKPAATKAPEATKAPVVQSEATSKPTATNAAATETPSSNAVSTEQGEGHSGNANPAATTTPDALSNTEEATATGQPAVDQNAPVEAAVTDGEVAEDSAVINEVSEEGVQVESASEFPEGEATNFTVDEEGKQGGTAAFVIIIVVALIFIAGAVAWIVMNNKRKK